ncbi:TetR family transcriptional regulator [Nocardioides aromaticivorans]|uniref:TetR family transcriptional regulator n=1 Tax=Nocardioides aromaticivorans TaxID=200618 RepID=A0ABX7PR40_9ACTN|nr:TetR/AcrR family transcriptional regulator [Nocardioides aromaticivorans]QSR28469.1 TetR family transcriptional regulator [Nocardioides aromaticivorans]
MTVGDLRQRLLRAAEQEIATSGPAKASLRGIARRVGVSHQATAHHFDDRAGLFTALAVEGFELLLEQSAAAVEAVGADGIASGAQVAAAGAAYVEFATRHPTMFDVMFRPELLHADDPRLLDVRRLHRDLLVQIVSAAQTEGWGAAVPTEELAAMGWAAVHGLAVLQRDAQLGDVLPEVDTGRLLERVARALDAIG